MNDQARALLFVAALFGGGGYTGGRVTAPAPPAEVRFVYLPAPAPLAESVPEEAPPAAAPVDRVTRAPLEPPAAAGDPPAVEAKTLPQPRPKIEAKPKPQPKPEPAKKPRAAAPARKHMPSCAVVKREYERMTASERWASYLSASKEEIAHGKRCLGM